MITITWSMSSRMAVIEWKMANKKLKPRDCSGNQRKKNRNIETRNLNHSRGLKNINLARLGDASGEDMELLQRMIEESDFHVLVLMKKHHSEDRMMFNAIFPVKTKVSPEKFDEYFFELHRYLEELRSKLRVHKG